ncbi:Sucraseferredoxin-like protein [Schizophyllum commune]
MAIISTGKSDWDFEVTWTKGSLASYLSGVKTKSMPWGSLTSSSGTSSSSSDPNVPPVKPVTGVFASTSSSWLSILNGSHATLSNGPGSGSANSDAAPHETVLVLPDYTLVTGVGRTQADAQALYDTALAPGARPGNTPPEMGTWVIPYGVVVLLCSHKRRDNRCAIAAKTLETSFCQVLASRGWQADTRLEDPTVEMGTDPLEAFRGTAKEKEAHIRSQLKGLQNEKRALILKNSHMGGHKFAGNCIIYTPAGWGVWYGRVTPHEVEAIVTQTIEGGKILPKLLRGGVNISKPGCQSLNEW